MAQYNPSVVSDSLGSSSTQRPGSPGSWCEMKSPSRPPSSLSEIGGRSVYSLSSHSSCEEEIKALRHKLNITHIDEVVTHLRETHKPALSANGLKSLEGRKPSNSTVPHFKPCPPRDPNHIRSDLPLMSYSIAEFTIPISALEHGDKECKYRENSLRASAFRMVPAASVKASGSVKDFFLKMEVTQNSDLDCLQPGPPAVQRTASRGQRGSRHRCLPQPDGLLSSLRIAACCSTRCQLDISVVEAQRGKNP